VLTLDQVRKIEWSKSYLWDIKFPTAPAPFNDWFPATNVTNDMGSLKSENFDIFTTNFSIPTKTSERSLSITFVDDAKHTLLDWITFWMHSIVSSFAITGNGFAFESGVLTLEQAVKQVDITRLTTRRSPIRVGNTSYTESYKVYPEGIIQFTGDSDGKVNTYTVKFIIAEVIGIPPYITNMLSKGITR